MKLSSDAGKAFACRRRDSVSSLVHCLRSSLIFFCLAKVFSLLELSRTLSNHMKSFRHRWLAPSLTDPTSIRVDLSSCSRYGSRLTLEETSPWTSSMAGEHSLGPSDAPCLGEASTAHGDPLFSMTLIHKAVMVFASSASDPDHVHDLLPSNLLISELNPSPKIFSTSPTSRRIDSERWLTKAKLWFRLLGLSLICGPLFLLKSSTGFSPSSILSRPRYESINTSQNPLIKTFLLDGLISRRHWSCREERCLIWFYECSSQNLLINSHLAKAVDILSSKNIDEHLVLKNLTLAHPVSHSVNQICLFRCIQSTIFLLAFIFFEYSLKYLETESIQKPPEGVSSLSPLQPSRTMTKCFRQTSRSLLRIPLLSDFKSLRLPSFPVRMRFSVPPSSCMEKNQNRILAVESCLVSTTHEAKTRLSKSQNLMIVTISKVPELFSEVSLTHHVLACGMLLSSFCLRVPMDLSYLIYVCKLLLLSVVISSHVLEKLCTFWVME